jgi:hypothetical protein
VIGLWTIVSLGSIFLHAPPDLAGKWELRPTNAASNTQPAHVLTIQQSGLFLEANLDGKNYSLRMLSHDLVHSQTPIDEFYIDLSAANQQIAFVGSANSDDYVVHTHGNLDGDWDAIRVVRTYPRRLADQPATQPAAEHAR